MSPLLKTVIVFVFICCNVGAEIVTPHYSWCAIESNFTLQQCQITSNVLGRAEVVVKKDSYVIYNSKPAEEYSYQSFLNDTKFVRNRLMLIVPNTKLKPSQIITCFDELFKHGPWATFISMDLFIDKDATGNATIWKDFLSYKVKTGRLVVGVVMGERGPKPKPYELDLVYKLNSFYGEPSLRKVVKGLELDAVQMSHTFGIMKSIGDFNPIIIKQHPKSEDWFINIPMLYQHLKDIENTEKYLFLSRAVHNQLATNPNQSIPYPVVSTTKKKIQFDTNGIVSAPSRTSSHILILTEFVIQLYLFRRKT